MTRFSTYREWSIDAAPIKHYKDFRACAVLGHRTGEQGDIEDRFLFSDPGDFGSRPAAEERSTA